MLAYIAYMDPMGEAPLPGVESFESAGPQLDGWRRRLCGLLLAMVAWGAAGARGAYLSMSSDVKKRWDVVNIDDKLI